MAQVVSLQDAIRSRRRRRAQELTRRCTRIVELNLRVAVELYDAAPRREKPIRARHIRKLSELLEYLLASG